LQFGPPSQHELLEVLPFWKHLCHSLVFSLRKPFFLRALHNILCFSIAVLLFHTIFHTIEQVAVTLQNATWAVWNYLLCAGCVTAIS
jgi:hypothetical protein